MLYYAGIVRSPGNVDDGNTVINCSYSLCRLLTSYKKNEKEELLFKVLLSHFHGKIASST